jgi:hypothetical protein
VFDTENSFLNRRINRINRNAKKKQNMQKLQKHVKKRNHKRTQSSTLDLLKLQNSVNIFNSTVEDVGGDIQSFKDEMRNLDYLKKLD